MDNHWLSGLRNYFINCFVVFAVNKKKKFKAIFLIETKDLVYVYSIVRLKLQFNT